MVELRQHWIERVWYARSWQYRLLLPLTGLFSLAVAVRRWAYANGIRKPVDTDVPVIVVGNISVGGTGKTPVTIWLARMLMKQGMQPGIISRGYRGNPGPDPLLVSVESEAEQVGDEAIVLAKQCECPVVVHPDRAAAARKVVELGVDVIVSDDGLQHYRLSRDVEIAVVDAERKFGNGQLLPAGPLREPLSRLAEVDVVLTHHHALPGPDKEVLSRDSDPGVFDFCLNPSAVIRIDHSEIKRLDDFAGKAVHAVAGIGHPERFFRMLESHHIKVYRHPLPDHAGITPADIRFDDRLDVLMTEKDAVKCRWANTEQCWYVPVDVDFGGRADDVVDLVISKLEENRGIAP